jgi:hypothetical protein
MRVAPIVGLAFAFLLAGCSGVMPALPGAQPNATQDVAPAATPASAPSPPAPGVATPSSAAVPVSPTPDVATPSSAVAPAPPAPAIEIPVKPTPKSLTAAAAPKATFAEPPKASSAPDLAKKAPPTLDLSSLKERLKDTKAIGLLTKIALKNQVDDLLEQFRAYYQGKLKTTLAELRRPYDLLVMKVLALLQDSDPSLASAIVASREAIWGILADPAKFATI